MVRAKFKITQKVITQTVHNGELQELITVYAGPVTVPGSYVDNKWKVDETHPNFQWWNATPTGALNLGTVKKAAADQLVLDKEYYVDFTPVEEVDNSPIMWHPV